MADGIPARVHVLLAQYMSLGIVIRRGPSKQVCTSLWDRTTDTFQIGQWLKGRIYERRCDLSPDGKYLIYFALNPKRKGPAGSSWTAVSIAPYLKAIVLIGVGHTWGGGGLFLSPDRYWAQTGIGDRLLRDSQLVQLAEDFRPTETFGGAWLGIYHWRLLRDGWVYQGRQEANEWKSTDRYEKDLKNSWVLRKLAHAQVYAPIGKGGHWEEHVLYFPATGEEIAYPDWEWADLDHERLVWSAQGMLYAGVLGNQGLAEQRTLYDFNDMTFERIIAPY